jgi:ATP-binding cassette, subfamily F, member 3
VLRSSRIEEVLRSSRNKMPKQDTKLTVSAQQSRFHFIDAPASKEILVKDLCIAIQQRELLSHAELFLKEGQHYVLVGRNGTGKSTLLRAIADGDIPNMPWTLDILLLGQTTLTEELDGLQLADETVLQHVLRSDKKLTAAQREAEILSSALESFRDPTQPVFAYRRIQYERLQVKLEHAKAKAARTSSAFRDGARGLKARKALIAAEAQVEDARNRTEANAEELSPDQVSAETRAAADMLSDIQSALEMVSYQNLTLQPLTLPSDGRCCR